jgi:hypothetical protein
MIKRLFLFVVLMVLAVPTALAQDPTATPAEGEQVSLIQCDTTTVLLAGLASRDYGYQPNVDTTRYDWGQYSDLFTDNMSGDMGMDATPEATVEGETEQATPEGQTDDGMTSGTVLQPLVVLDEDIACAELRDDVMLFFDNMNTDNTNG